MTTTIKSAFAALSEEYQLPGLSIAWSLPSGELHTAAYGLADVEQGEILTARHRMPAGSVGKTFTAALALYLASTGAFDLDESIARWLEADRWFGRLPHGKDISMRMLLSHTSGVADHRFSPQFAAALQRHLKHSPPDRDLYFDPATLVGFVLTEPASFAPGSGFCYSETGFIIAGMVIERAGGAPFYAQLRRTFLEPLGLDDTIPADTRDIAGLAQGYAEPNEWGIPELAVENGRLALNPATEWSGGGIVSTSSDLARWSRILLTGQALETGYLEEMLEPTVPSVDAARDYGLGCYRWSTTSGAAFGHSGETMGYRSILAYLPAPDVAMAIQLNTSRVPHSILTEFLRQFAELTGHPPLR